MARTALTVGPFNTTGTSTTTAFTVPSGHKYQILQVHALNRNAASQGFVLSKGAPSSGSADAFNGLDPILTPGQVYDWYTDMSFESGTTCQVSATVGTAVVFYFMGWDYTP